MNLRHIALALFAATSLLPGTTVSERLDRLEAEVSKMQALLRTLSQNQSAPAPRRETFSQSASNYQIRKGDSYWSISRRFQISVAALERANPGVNPRRLSIGQSITLPGAQGISSTAGSQQTGTYRVKSGDILGRISEAHGIRLYQLLDANPGLNPRRLKIGTLLKIPGQTPRSAPSPEPVLPVETPPERTTPSAPTSSRVNPYLSESQADEDAPPVILFEEPRLITVQEDTRLSEIAEQHKTTVARINSLNQRDLSPKQMIKEGSQLFVPPR